MGVSEEVRSRCHVKYSVQRCTSDAMSQDTYISDNLSNSSQHSGSLQGSNSSSGSGGVNRRQKSWDLLDQSAIAQARQHKQPPSHQVSNL